MMSFKTGLVKLAINLTPNIFIKWAANAVLKGIAHFSDFKFDLDTRTVYISLTLYGETEPIELSVDHFYFFKEDGYHYLVIEKAQGNRPWLTNLLSRIAGKTWKIPAIPAYQEQIDLVAELFQAESAEVEERS